MLLPTRPQWPPAETVCATLRGFDPGRPLARFRWAPLSLACLLASLGAGAAWAEPSAALALTMSTRLQENLPRAQLEQIPIFLAGDRISGEIDAATVIEGQVELRRHDLVLRADRLERSADNTVIASGNVRINREGDRFEGTVLELQLDTNRGRFKQPTFSFLRTGGHGDASRVDFEGRDRLVAYQVRYTTCPRTDGDAWSPDWYVSASRIVFDQVDDTGTATNGVLRFKGVPLLASPWISFPLSDRRKSGVLPPTFNIDNRSGVEVTLPYYLNLAPNRDATLFPTLMSRRGLDLGGEYRYLERNHAGVLRASYMANDRLRDEDRWAVALQHQHVLAALPGTSPLSLRLNLNRVSDDNYWRDFPRSSTSLTERLLPNDVVLTTSAGPWSFSAGAHRWQTLQDPDDEIRAPYDRLPSLAASYNPAPWLWAGRQPVTWSLLTDATTFRTDRAPVVGGRNEITDVNSTRLLGQAQFSTTWQTPGWYIRPALRLHARHYQFDQAAGPLGHRSRRADFLIPSVSLDTGLFFDRQAKVFGRDALQTLEPRLFYTQTPFREQGYLPVYDSAAFDFNLATIFSSSTFTGHDRVADLHAITLGLTSRVLSPETGAEWASIGVAQRIRLSDQRVVLPGLEPVTETLSDLLFGGSVNWTPEWAFNGTVQFNPESRQSVRTTLGGRYSPGHFRVVSAAYRLQRGESEQMDVAWQWPLSDLIPGPRVPAIGPGRGLGPGHWYSVGRVNVSLKERRVVDLIAGFEYDAGCWIGRIVLERLQQSRTSANQRILFQLEFSGFSRLGSNPLQTLRDNIPRYQFLREQINPPSRFERYD